MNGGITIGHVIEEHFEVVIVFAQERGNGAAKHFVIGLGHEGFRVGVSSARKQEATKPSGIKRGKEFQGFVDEIPTTHIGNTFHKSTELGSHCHELDCVFIEYYLRVFFFHIHAN